MSAALIAGGRGRRLGGVAKGLIEVEGRTLGERLVDLLEPICGPVLLVANDPSVYAALNVPTVRDVIAGKGPPGGVHAALTRSPAGWVFVAAIDLPWLDRESVTALAEAREGHDVALWRADGWLQPLAGWWHTRCGATLDRLLRAGDPGFRSILAELDVRVLEAPDARPFTNLNTPEDLEWAGARAPTV